MNSAVELRPNISVQGQRTANNTKEDNDDETQHSPSKISGSNINYKYITIGVFVVIIILLIVYLIYRYHNKKNKKSPENTKENIINKKPVIPVVSKEEPKQKILSSEDAFLNATTDDNSSIDDGCDAIKRQNQHKIVENKPIEPVKQKIIDIYDPVTKTYTPHPTKVGDNEIIDIDIESEEDEEQMIIQSPQQKLLQESTELINIPQGVRNEAIASTNKSGQLLNRETITPQELKNITKIYNGKKFSKFITGKTVSNLLKKVVIN